MINNLMTLPALFTDRIFRIPDYQRGYAWSERELDDLWDDFQLLLSSPGHPHYTGVITVEEVSDVESKKLLGPTEDWLVQGGKLFLIVDGQQRLTTLIILIHELLRWHTQVSPGNPAITPNANRDSAKERFICRTNQMVKSSYGYLFGYADEPDTDAYLRRYILDDCTITSPDRQSLYTQNLSTAKQYFSKHLADYAPHGGAGSATKLGELYALVTNRLQFNFFQVSSDLDVCMTFEAISNRGKPLTDLEKLKSRFIYLAGLLAGRDKNKLAIYRKKINDCWKKVYSLLGRVPNITLSEDEFLNAMWIAYFGKYGDIAREEHLFNQEFSRRLTVGAPNGWQKVESFACALADAAPSWAAVRYPDQIQQLMPQKQLSQPIPAAAIPFLEKLHRLGMRGLFRPLLLAAVVKHQQGNILDNDLIKLVQAVERYIMLVFGIADRKSNTGQSTYFREAYNLYTSPGQAAALSQRIQQEADWRFDPHRFVSAVKDWFGGDRKGFFEWDELRYALFEYEESLFAKKYPNNPKQVAWNVAASQKLTESIEHIYPQTATDPSWISAFGPTQNKLLCHALGDLLLLCMIKNASLQNRPYAEKAHGANGYRDPYKNGSYSEQEVAGRWHNWTPAAICERTRELLDFIGKHWSVPATGWQQAMKDVLSFLGCPSPSHPASGDLNHRAE